MQKMELNKRAKIFMPYDALKGFRELLNEASSYKVEKKILTKDSLEELDYKLKEIQIGMLVEILYYNEKLKKEEVVRGVLSKIDYINKQLVIVKQKIDVRSIYKIDIVDKYAFK